jgi:hypothetical protein
MDTTLKLKDVRKTLAAIGMEIEKTEYDEYRVNFRNGKEASAYYATDLEDALGTGTLMERRRRENC